MNPFRHSVIPHSFLAIPLLLLAGCCNCHPPGGTPSLANLPPPISAEEQLALLNARAAQLPFLRAHIAHLEIDYLDDKKKPQKVPVDTGALALRQHPTDIQSPADIYITGRFLDQTVLDLGKNDRQFWYAIYGNIKEAHIGNLSQSPSFSAAPHDLFRADLHLQLLALSPILPAPDRIIALQPDDLTGKNYLYIERITSNGLAQIERRLIIDRFTGHIDEVDLYDTTPEGGGTLLARSQLSNYQTPDYADGTQRPENPPTIPTDILIDFPTLKSTITLHLINLRIPASIPDKVFQPADFQSQGLKVIPIE